MSDSDGGFGFCVGVVSTLLFGGSVLASFHVGYSFGQGNSSPELKKEIAILREENNILYNRNSSLEKSSKKQTCIGFFCSQNQEN